MINTRLYKTILCSLGLVFVLISGVLNSINYDFGMCIAALFLDACLILDVYTLYKEKRYPLMILCSICVIGLIVFIILILK